MAKFRLARPSCPVGKLSIVLSCTLLSGCGLALFDAKGPISDSIRSTMTYTTSLMLIVIIPTLILALYIPYHYRASNTKARYEPEWYHSTLIEIIIWGVPIIIISFLAVETYRSTFAIDPNKVLASDKYSASEALKIQVIALDWKWLFIYPEEGIATVNEIAIPVDRPVQFLLTSDAAINSFFIPRLGSQLYAMNGMEGKLSLMATEPGIYEGLSSNYSGHGFSGMRFKVHATDEPTYESWLTKVANSPKRLDDATYEKLTEQTRDHPVEYFVNTDPLRFRNVIEANTELYEPASANHLTGQSGDKGGHDAGAAH